MAESWRTEKKRPKIKVLPWPAIPPPTVEEVYAGVDEKKKEYNLWIESAVRQQFNAVAAHKREQCVVLPLESGFAEFFFDSSQLALQDRHEKISTTAGWL